MHRSRPQRRVCARPPGAAGVRPGRRLRRARGGPGVGRERGRGGRSSPRRLKATGSNRGSWNILMLVIFTDLQQLCGLSITGEENSTCGAETREEVEPSRGTETPSSSYGPQPPPPTSRRLT